MSIPSKGLVLIKLEWKDGAARLELPEDMAKLLPSAMMSAFAAQAFTPDDDEDPGA